MTDEITPLPVDGAHAEPDEHEAAERRALGRRDRWWNRSRSDWTTFAVGALLTILVVAVAVLAGRVYTFMSPYDEAVHYDYIYKIVSEKSIPAAGLPISQNTVNEISCHGIVWLEHPTCQHFTAKDTPLQGLNYALTYTPVYHLAAALIAGPLAAITGMDLFSASRIASALFLGSGVALMFWVLRRLGVNRWFAAGGLLAVVASPIVIFQGSTVSPDSTMMLVAALALLPLLSRRRWRYRLIFGILIAILISLTKASYMPVGIITVLIAGFAPLRDAPGERQGRWIGTTALRFWLTGFATAIPVLAQYGASQWRESMVKDNAGVDALNKLLETHQSFVSIVIDATKSMVLPFSSAALPNSALLSVPALFLSILIFGGSARLAADRWKEDRTLPLSALIGIVGFGVAAIMIPSIFYFTAHSVGSQPRYTVPIAMFLAAVLLASIRSRPAMWIIGIGGALSFLATAAKIYSEHPW